MYANPPPTTCSSLWKLFLYQLSPVLVWCTWPPCQALPSLYLTPRLPKLLELLLRSLVQLTFSDVLGVDTVHRSPLFVPSTLNSFPTLNRPWLYPVFGVNTSKRRCACGYFGCGWGVGWVGWDGNVHCDCNHTVRSLALPRCCTFSCTSTHTSCYAAARSLALPHMRHATSQNSLLCWWLQSLERSLQTTSARKMPQMAKLCPQPRWVCEATGRKPRKRVLFGRNTDFRQTVGLVKNTTPRQLNTHKDCRQDFRKFWKYLYAAVWHKSVKGNVLNNLGQLCAWKEKRNFSAKPSTNETPVSCL